MKTTSAKTGSHLPKIALSIALILSFIPIGQPQVADAATVAPVVSIASANTGKVTMKLGSSYKLGAKATIGSKVYYSSSNKRIVTVSTNGTLKAKKPGKATITVKAKKSGKTTTKKVKVTVVKAKSYKAVKSISAKARSSSVIEGGSTTISTAFKPSNASNKNLTYKSSNTSVATVSATGKVTTKKPGTVKITVTSCANAKAKSTVTVKVGESELTKASEALASAKAALDKASADAGKAASDLDRAHTNLESAQAAYDEAKAAYDAADMGDVPALKQAMDDAKAAYDAAKDVSIADFYKERGSNEAYAIMTGMNIDGTVNEDYGDPSGDEYVEGYVDHIGTDVYGENSSMSYDNVMVALDQLDYYNNLRKNLGLEESLVTDNCMAAAQGNADYDTYVYETTWKRGHYGLGYGAENLAYSTNVEYCWIEWYDVEKKRFDAYYEEVTGEKCELVGAEARKWYSANTSSKGKTFGHYLNIIDPTNKYSGMGWNTESPTLCQQFSSWEPKGTKTYTVDEWREQFKEWHGRQTGKAELKAAYDEAKAAYDEANAPAVALDKASAALEAARDELSKVESADEVAKRNLDAAQAAYDRAKKTYEALALATAPMA